MRCPTCNRRVPRGKDTCSSCGAFVGNAYLGEARGGGLIIPPKAPEKAPERPVRGFPVETPEPEPPELSGLPGFPGLEDAEDARQEQGPSSAGPTPPPPPPPKYAGLLRILFPLLFILIPLFNLLVRNAPFGADELPQVQETRFYEDVSAGRFINAQTVFSRSRHEQVVLFVRWNGSRGRHEYLFRWYTPEGNLLPNTSSITRFQFGDDEGFSAFALLPLNEKLPLGTWRVEVAVGEEVQAQPTFELQP